MSPFLTFRDIDKNGKLQYYVVQRDFPHYLGIINLNPNPNAIIEFTMPGYNLWLTFHGTLRGNMIPGYKDELKNMETVFRNMAEWYLNSRILIDPKKYKKFKAYDTSTAQ